MAPWRHRPLGRNEYDLGGVWNVCVARSQENRDVVLRIYDETFRFTFFCVLLFVITANVMFTSVPEVAGDGGTWMEMDIECSFVYIYTRCCAVITRRNKFAL